MAAPALDIAGWSFELPEALHDELLPDLVRWCCAFAETIVGRSGTEPHLINPPVPKLDLSADLIEKLSIDESRPLLRHAAGEALSSPEGGRSIYPQQCSLISARFQSPAPFRIVFASRR